MPRKSWYGVMVHPRSPTREVHQTSVSRDSLKVSLQRHDWLTHWPRDWTQAPTGLPSLVMERLKNPNLLIMSLVFLVTSSHPETTQGGSLIGITKNLLTLWEFQEFLKLETRYILDYTTDLEVGELELESRWVWQGPALICFFPPQLQYLLM